MGFVRRNMFYIICSAAAAGGVVLAVTGLGAMPKVLAEMEQAKRLYEDLNSLQHNPVNQRRIEIEERRITRTLEDRDKVLTEAKKLYNYEPLVPHAFPNGNDDARREFRRKLAIAFDRLFDSLNAGPPATSAEISAMQDRIADEEAREREIGLDAGAVQRKTVDLGQHRTPAGVLTKAGAKKDAAARAHIAAAQRISCYATHHKSAKARGTTAVRSLDFNPAMEDIGTVDAPDPEEVWQAQVGYWIQKDIVDAIVAVNDEAARRAKERGLDRWVGISPVKEIISIRVSEDYVLPGEEDFYAGATAEGSKGALPPGTGGSVFTGTTSNGLFEVMQFTLKLVMDQGDIPRLVKELCANSFHTLLRVGYTALPANKDMRGKIYGSESTVLVVMDFETVMLGEVFRPMMPAAVCEQLADEGYGVECPSPEEDEEEG